MELPLLQRGTAILGRFSGMLMFGGGTLGAILARDLPPLREKLLTTSRLAIPPFWEVARGRALEEVQPLNSDGFTLLRGGLYVESAEVGVLLLDTENSQCGEFGVRRFAVVVPTSGSDTRVLWGSVKVSLPGYRARETKDAFVVALNGLVGTRPSSVGSRITEMVATGAPGTEEFDPEVDARLNGGDEFSFVRDALLEAYLQADWFIRVYAPSQGLL